MTGAPSGPRWPIATTLLLYHLPFLAIVWVAILALTALCVTGVAIFGTVTASALDQAGSVLRWFALGYGAHLTYQLLPTYIVHGRTRREYASQVTVFIALGSAFLAGLMTLAYYLESLLYRAADWQRGIMDDRMYSSGEEWLAVFCTYGVLFAVWTTVGGVLAAAFSRSGAVGLLSVPLGLGIVVMAGAVIGFNGLPVVGLLTRGHHVTSLPAVALCSGAFLIATALHWVLVRDIPVRTPSSSA